MDAEGVGSGIRVVTPGQLPPSLLSKHEHARHQALPQPASRSGPIPQTPFPLADSVSGLPFRVNRLRNRMDWLPHPMGLLVNPMNRLRNPMSWFCNPMNPFRNRISPFPNPMNSFRKPNGCFRHPMNPFRNRTNPFWKPRVISPRFQVALGKEERENPLPQTPGPGPLVQFSRCPSLISPVRQANYRGIQRPALWRLLRSQIHPEPRRQRPRMR